MAKLDQVTSLTRFAGRDDSMTIPEKIKINWIEDYHTETIGRAGSDLQFMGFVVQARLNDTPINHEEPFKVFAVLYTFDRDGSLLATEHWCAGTRRGSMQEVASLFESAGNKLEELMSKLGTFEYGHVEVRLFSVTIDGILFGLVDGSYTRQGKTYERIKLVPNDIVFSAPYDGSYET